MQNEARDDPQADAAVLRVPAGRRRRPPARGVRRGRRGHPQQPRRPDPQHRCLQRRREPSSPRWASCSATASPWSGARERPTWPRPTPRCGRARRARRVSRTRRTTTSRRRPSRSCSGPMDRGRRSRRSRLLHQHREPQPGPTSGTLRGIDGATSGVYNNEIDTGHVVWEFWTELIDGTGHIATAVELRPLLDHQPLRDDHGPDADLRAGRLPRTRGCRNGASSGRWSRNSASSKPTRSCGSTRARSLDAHQRALRHEQASINRATGLGRLRGAAGDRGNLEVHASCAEQFVTYLDGRALRGDAWTQATQAKRQRARPAAHARARAQADDRGHAPAIPPELGSWDPVMGVGPCPRTLSRVTLRLRVRRMRGVPDPRIVLPVKLESLERLPRQILHAPAIRRREWCPGLESNQHGNYPTRSLVLRVYQFRHPGKVFAGRRQSSPTRASSGGESQGSEARGRARLPDRLRVASRRPALAVQCCDSAR